MSIVLFLPKIDLNYQLGIIIDLLLRIRSEKEFTKKDFFRKCNWKNEYVQYYFSDSIFENSTIGFQQFLLANLSLRFRSRQFVFSHSIKFTNLISRIRLHQFVFAISPSPVRCHQFDLVNLICFTKFVWVSFSLASSINTIACAHVSSLALIPSCCTRYSTCNEA